MAGSPLYTLLTHVFAAYRLNHVIWGSSKQLCNDGELIDMILAREKRLSLQHLCEDAPSTPNVDLNVIFLPREHDFGCAIVSRRDVAGHLRILYPGKAKVTNLQIAVLIYKDIAGFEVAMNDTGRVDIFQAPLLRVSHILRIPRRSSIGK